MHKFNKIIYKKLHIYLQHSQNITMDPKLNQIIQQSIWEGILKSIPTLIQILWPFFLPVIIIAFIKILFQVYKNHQLSKVGMLEIDKMSGEEFELFLVTLFQKMGYKTQHVGSSINDFGADIILEKGGVRTAVQAKCWHTVIKESSVQEVYTSMKIHNCTKALVVTNNFFSWHARQLAKTNGVELWNRTKLTNVILNQQKQNSTSTNKAANI